MSALSSVAHAHHMPRHHDRGMKKTIATTALLLVSATVPVLGAGAAQANDRDVVRHGSCSGSTDWKIKAGLDDGRIEVESEIDSNRAGQTWNWTLTHNGAAAGSGTRKTAGASGSFEVRRVTGNRAGTDTYVFTARRPGTQQICRGTVRF